MMRSSAGAIVAGRHVAVVTRTRQPEILLKPIGGPRLRDGQKAKRQCERNARNPAEHCLCPRGPFPNLSNRAALASPGQGTKRRRRRVAGYRDCAATLATGGGPGMRSRGDAIASGVSASVRAFDPIHRKPGTARVDHSFFATVAGYRATGATISRPKLSTLIRRIRGASGVRRGLVLISCARSCASRRAKQCVRRRRSPSREAIRDGN